MGGRELYSRQKMTCCQCEQCTACFLRCCSSLHPHPGIQGAARAPLAPRFLPCRVFVRKLAARRCKRCAMTETARAQVLHITSRSDD